jgi:pimeloyl-ACP methyl ester carboxylesterase
MAMVLTSDGVRLNVTDQGAGPAVLMVAGFTAPATSWAFQADALLDAGYRVLCLDRRSHGESDAPAYGQRMSRHGKDIGDTLDALGLDDVAVVGGSMGASSIWAYIDLFGDARLRGIVSVDQTPKMINTDDWPHGFYGLTDGNAGTFFAAGVPPTGRGYTFEQMMPGLTRLSARVGGGGPRFELRPEMLPLLRDHALADWRDVINRVTKPVLMVAGRDSQYWSCEHAAATAAIAQNGESIVIDDCGHGSNIDRPEEFNAHLIGFLEGL